ncbi:MAG: CehA/McbA family metallohydrolase [Gemmatimonadetes bacterium]|nr:CehA/McbA family metallohydrolase [Gemmatimonadota bacterium]
MSTLTGKIVDAETGAPVQARVQVLGPAGNRLAPAGAMWKVGPGEPFFYSDGEFSVETPRGRVQVLAERGTEYTPWRRTVECRVSGTLALDIALERWGNLPERGWHPGNTHIHYNETEGDPDRRLRYDSRVENLRMTAVSILKRWDLAYATNRYPPGVLNEFTDTHHYVQCGEESRHNAGAHFQIGYGHIMLLGIRNVVEPVSTGLLVDPFEPDYPPLSYACDDAKRQGGLVIWCHNGNGMECPVASILGKVDAMNLFDPWWQDTEYDIWYRLLNCGVKLPASTGSDWFVCSANRVYAKTRPEFDYESWMQALRDGRTFVTNGPALDIAVDGRGPGETVQARPGGSVTARVEWSSHYAVHRVDVIANGSPVHTRSFPDGSARGSFECNVPVGSDGWMAARIGSNSRDSFAQAIWAHTSPVYVDAGGAAPPERAADAAWFARQIDESLSWASSGAKFYTDRQRDEVVDLFRRGRDLYRRLAR